MEKLLFSPSRERVKDANMLHFMDIVERATGQSFADYNSLYEWSVTHIPTFWELFFDYAQIRHEGTPRAVVDDIGKMPGARWFEGVRLNFAENLLRYRDDREALVFYGEGGRGRTLTYGELYTEVGHVAASLKKMGVVSGDRVVGFMPNIPETVIAMLAAVSLGAIWSSCSPDFGIKGVLDRFGQIMPKVLFCADGYRFKGRSFDSIKKVESILPDLPSVEKVVVTPYISSQPDIGGLGKGVLFEQFVSSGETEAGAGEISFEQFPFEHPLYIMFTSGTTGLPKCMVQSAGGILLHQMKELLLHTDLKRDDGIFYFTTCGWMMWNWLVCSLSVGAKVVLFDGNPFFPDPGVLWRMAEQEALTVFGTSAGYLQALMNTDLNPKRDFRLMPLKTVLSTGSPLSEEGFEYVYDKVKSDVQLSSISGGSDINGCFALGNPLLPVVSGQLQCRGLAMKVESFDENGTAVFDKPGELVCTAPFPSMPLYFWNDEDGQRYHQAYFDVFPNVWRHGDYVEIKSDTGGVVIHGRSDATLNPGGVRIGTAEIYRQVEGVDGVADSLVVGQRWKGDVRVILFVKMETGVLLTESLKAEIKDNIRKNASVRHVPKKIISISDIPYTINMKKVELAVKNVIDGRPVLNRAALSNPASLSLFEDLAELKED